MLPYWNIFNLHINSFVVNVSNCGYGEWSSVGKLRRVLDRPSVVSGSVLVRPSLVYSDNQIDTQGSNLKLYNQFCTHF